MMNTFLTVSAKMSSNRYLGAIRDAFVFAMPLTMAAAFAVMINNVLLATNLPFSLANPAHYSEGFIAVVTDLKYIFTSVTYGSLDILAIVIVTSLGYILSVDRTKNAFVNALIMLGVFFVLFPKGALVPETGVAWNNYWAARNLFTSLILGILGTECLLWLQNIDALKITLPESVPPAVANSFTIMFPAFILYTIMGTIAYIFMKFQPLGYSDASLFISGVFQAPFLALAKSPIGGWGIIYIFVFFTNFLWTFGLHGTNILSGFSAPTLGVLATENQTLYAQTGNAMDPELAIFTSGFVPAYTSLGGSGATIGLIIAIFIFSKREDYRAISKLSLAPGIFEINEPIVFGLPVVLNPILVIPFVLAPCSAVILPGILMQMNILPRIVISVPWVTPPVINAFLATGASPLAAVVALFNIVLVTIIYIPFVFIANKQAESEVIK
jgi:PTS system, lactose/cellobiose family IIC component